MAPSRDGDAVRFDAPRPAKQGPQRVFEAGPRTVNVAERLRGARTARARAKARPRVCIVRHNDFYEPKLQREAEALANAGMDVEVLLIAPDRPNREVVNGVDVTMLRGARRKSSKLRYLLDYSAFFLRAAATLTVRHLRRPYAVVQVNTVPDFLVFAAAVPKLRGARVVAFMHEPSPELAETIFGSRSISRVLAVIEQRVLRFADHSITVTDQLKQRFAERGADPDRISVVLNGADPDSWLRDWSPPQESSANGKFTVICSSLVEDRYGLDTIVEAARLLRDELPDLEVVLTGRGPGVDDLVRTIEEWKLQDVVRWEGFVSKERLSDLLYTADVGIVAQKASPYSHLVHTNKMVDYWIFGLPVIASRLRAVSETYDGALEFYEPGDPADLARAIRRLHDDPARREELARRGKVAERDNGWKVQERTYLGVFEALLGDRHSGVAALRSSSAEAAPARTPRLERLLQAGEPGRVDGAIGTGPPAWLSVGDWRLLARPRLAEPPPGDVVERFALPSGRTVAAVKQADGTVYVPFDLDEAYRNYVTEAWRGRAKMRALKDWQLAIYYRLKGLLPREFWLQARRAFIRAGRRPEFPAWPLEEGVDRLVRFSGYCRLLAADAEEATFPWFWPEGRRAAFILTHDVESAEGLRLAVELADLEEARGLRSSFNIVADDYEIDFGVVRELRDRGFEIGLHGLHHDRALFSSREEFERQLPRLAEAAGRLGAVGFRSPSTYRVPEWLGELPVQYDCSVPHSDPYEPQPGGCCGLWPYMLDDVVELPYTLPQDHTLLTLLRERSPRPWLEQAAAIERRFGLIQSVTHPDPGYLADADKRAVYVEFLDAMVGREELWHALPREVADWWRRRERGETTDEQLGTMRRADAPHYAVFEPPASS